MMADKKVIIVTRCGHCPHFWPLPKQFACCHILRSVYGNKEKENMHWEEFTSFALSSKIIEGGKYIFPKCPLDNFKDRLIAHKE